jgi:hypothetical protein
MSVGYGQPIRASRRSRTKLALIASATVVAAVSSLVAAAQSTLATAKLEPPNGDVYIGVDSDANNLAGFDNAVGIPQPAIVGGYTWPDGPLQSVIAPIESASPNSVPMVSWNVPMTNDQITDGSEDAYIEAQAAAVKSYGKPVFIRPDWEMNATWSPGYDITGGVSPAQYVASWQHIYKLFSGVTNAVFVWCPNSGDPTGQQASAWYPGDAYVDWIGLDSYPEFGSANGFLASPDGANDMANFAAEHGKPLMLAEWGPNTMTMFTDNSSTVELVFNWAKSFPNTVKAIVYFNYIAENGSAMSSSDFLLRDHPNVAAEFRKELSGDTGYLHSVVSP